MAKGPTKPKSPGKPKAAEKPKMADKPAVVSKPAPAAKPAADVMTAADPPPTAGKPGSGLPKGAGLMVVALVVALAAWGGWKWHATEQAKKELAEKRAAEVRRLSVQGEPRSVAVGGGGGGAPAATFTPQQFGAWGAIPPEQQYEAGEVIVADPPPAFATSIGSLGFAVLETFRLNNIGTSVYRLRIPVGMSVDEARRRLAVQYPGISLDANHHYQAQQLQGRPADFPAKLPRALAGWNPGTPGCGAGVRLGMVDAAVDVNHPALRGQDIQFRSFHKEGSRAGSADHGTAVAAIMVGKPEWGGLLPGATLRAGNMFETNEVGKDVGSAVGLLKSVDWLLAEKVQAINFSVAGSDNKIVRGIIEKIAAKNLVIVAAAGNWGTDQRPAFPAAYNEVMAVTAFGDRGTLYAHANFGPYIDFAAPGVDVFTAVPGGGGKLQSGTSFASPFLAVLAALEVARGQPGNKASMQSLLSKTIIDLGPAGRDPQFGWGYVAKQPAC